MSRLLTRKEKQIIEGFCQLIVDNEKTLLSPFLYANEHQWMAKSWFRYSKNDGDRDKILVVTLLDPETKQSKRVNVMPRPYLHRVFMQLCEAVYLNSVQVKRLIEKLQEIEKAKT